jgi:hypothetical protein
VLLIFGSHGTVFHHGYVSWFDCWYFGLRDSVKSVNERSHANTCVELSSLQSCSSNPSFSVVFKFALKLLNKMFVRTLPIFLHKLRIGFIRVIELSSINVRFDNFQELFTAFRCLAPLISEVRIQNTCVAERKPSRFWQLVMNQEERTLMI